MGKRRIQAIQTDNAISAEPVVKIGSTVTVKVNGKMYRFTIVNTPDVSPSQGIISDRSPLGQKLLGKTIGEKLLVATPSTTHEYTLLQIL